MDKGYAFRAYGVLDVKEYIYSKGSSVYTGPPVSPRAPPKTSRYSFKSSDPTPRAKRTAS
eukprot:scaffold2383_cov161-Amphora_coffeaeformis.AAC.8